MGLLRKNTSRNKVVYVLGAGFSKPAGSPLQGELLANILRMVPDADSDGQIFEEKRRGVVDFLNKMFHGVDLEKLNITDVYTILDKAIINDEPLQGFSSEQIREIKKALNSLIIYSFDKILLNANKGYIEQFLDHVIFRKIKSNSSLCTDSVSFIDLNWDIVFDSVMYRKFKTSGKLIVDYGFPITPFWGTGFAPPYLLRHKGIFPVKLLKLHGSMNWLLCRGCGRVYGAQENKISLFEMFGGGKWCRKCREFLNQEVFLNSMLITPTFLKKDLENVYLKQIWQQAKQEISTAKKIVFLGYSFPDEDFEIRYLLKRNMCSDCSVDVVLTGGDNISSFNVFGEERRILESKLPPYRYKNFFNLKKIRFFFEGVENYLTSLTVNE